MADNSLYKILFDGATPNLLVEIIMRTFIMFLLILIILRISGRRGVRQLTLFEVAIILGLGSAAGDPMFQEDLPIFHAILVFLTVILLYKGITWLTAKFSFVNRIMEGEPFVVVRDGEFAVTDENVSSFSKMEFFAELRNSSIEHLGQVRLAVLETDGSMSILRYDNSKVKFGLPLFPDDYKEIVPSVNSHGPYACMYCGKVLEHVNIDFTCPVCHKKKWTKAINNKYC
ncbi:DUF421 domain-containing protein [Sphingobacterium cellulitidis]|uniref:DUF421 domain-containing protein n=1 Tax=Sphingobacterium cellulitidis TaxID=1768011 RepID=UPI000B941983|nr:hypothetical protein CHT99_09910 [Sphingobacterium cellulitidis]